MKAQITVDPRLIPTMGRSLYSGHTAAIAVRELLQNSWDACIAKDVKPEIHIRLDVSEFWSNNAEIVVTCRDNGIGMTEKQLLEDYLCLGVTGKKRLKETGGFGIANAVVFSAKKWEVKSLNHYASPDENYEIDIVKLDKPINGTEVKLTLESHITVSTLRDIFRIIYLSDVDVKFSYYKAGKLQYEDSNAGFSQLKDVRITREEFADVVDSSLEDVRILDGFKVHEYEIEGYDIVRMNGLVQFTEYQTSKRKTNLIFDLSIKFRPTDAKYPLTLSREAVSGDTEDQIDHISRLHTVDVLTSYRKLEEPKEPVRRIIDGYTIKGSRGRGLDDEIEGLSSIRLQSGEMVAVKAQQFYRDENGDPKILLEDGREIAIRLPGEDDFGKTHSERYYSPSCTAEYVDVFPVLDQIGMENLPTTKPRFHKSIAVMQDNYIKDPKKVKAHAKILRAWREILTITASFEENFGIGITSQGWVNGKRSVYDGDIFYIVNPDCIEDVETNAGKALRLWHLACHECAHAVHDIHDEAFASEMGRISVETADAFWKNIVRISRLL